MTCSRIPPSSTNRVEQCGLCEEYVASYPDPRCGTLLTRSSVASASLRPKSIMSAARWKSSKPQASRGTDTMTSGGYPANRYRVMTFDMVSYDRFTISRALRSTDSLLLATPDTSQSVSEPA